MFVELFVFFFTLVIAYLIWSRYRTLQLRDKMGLGGPPTNFLLGNSHQMGAYIHKNGPQMAKLFQKWTNEYGKVFGFYMGPRYWVMVSDLDMAKDVLIKQFNSFTDRMEMILLRKALSSSIINLHGQDWKDVRSAVTPTFSGGKMKQMSLVIKDKLDILLNNMEKKAENGESFDIYASMKALTLDVIGKCAFAMNVNCQTDPTDPFLQNGIKFFREQPSPENSTLVKFSALLPEFGPFWTFVSNMLGIAQAEKYLFSNLEQIIDHRIQDQTFKSLDIMQLLLDQRIDEDNPKKIGLTIDQVASNCFVFLLAGYETTSTALGFTCWLLAKHPDEQRKLQEELDKNVSDESEINYDLVHRLPYLDAVFHESLRLFPPVVMFTSRTCTQKCWVGNVEFEPGVQVMIPNYTIHRDPDIWPQPDLFIPERFFKNKDYHPLSWIPFGAGPRNCVGLRFAEMEYKLTIARLLYKFTIEAGSDFEDPVPIINHNVLFAPSRVLVKIVPRNSK